MHQQLKLLASAHRLKRALIAVGKKLKNVRICSWNRQQKKCLAKPCTAYKYLWCSKIDYCSWSKSSKTCRDVVPTMAPTLKMTEAPTRSECDDVVDELTRAFYETVVKEKYFLNEKEVVFRSRQHRAEYEYGYDLSLSVFAPTMQFMSDLESVSLVFPDISRKDAHALSMGLRHTPQLKRFEIASPTTKGWLRNQEFFNGEPISVQLDEEAAKLIADGLKSSRELDQLTLVDTALGDAGALHFAATIPFHTHLNFITMANCQIGNEVAVALASSIGSSPPIGLGGVVVRTSFINFASNLIQDAGAKAFATTINRLRSLGVRDVYFSFAGNLIGDDGIIALSEAAQNFHGTSVSRISLFMNMFDNDFGDVGASHIARTLAGTDITDRDSVSINLQGNRIGNAALLSFRDAFETIRRSNPKLFIAMNLENNAITDTGISLILNSFPSLDYLFRIGGNPIGDKGVKFIEFAIDQKKSWAYEIVTSLSNCGIGNEGARTLASIIRKWKNPGLQEGLVPDWRDFKVDFSENNISDDGAKAIFDAISQRGDVRSINMRGNALTDVSARHIASLGIRILLKWPLSKTQVTLDLREKTKLPVREEKYYYKNFTLMSTLYFLDIFTSSYESYILTTTIYRVSK